MKLVLVDDVSDKIKLIKDRLKETQNRQRQYYDPDNQAFELQVANFVFLKVDYMKDVSKFGREGKLSLRFTGSFEVINRVG